MIEKRTKYTFYSFMYRNWIRYLQKKNRVQYCRRFPLKDEKKNTTKGEETHKNRNNTTFLHRTCMLSGVTVPYCTYPAWSNKNQSIRTEGGFGRAL